MRTITRVGLFVGAAGLIALYGLQIVAGLFVVPAVLLIGVIAGLCVAKWLERGWSARGRYCLWGDGCWSRVVPFVARPPLAGGARGALATRPTQPRGSD